MDDHDLKSILLELARLLEDGGQDRSAGTIRQALRSGIGQKLEEFLVSNELWGGAGSIADESLVSDDARRRDFEHLMLKLGRLQLARGKTNPRTETWVRAFEQWRHAGPR
jgi:hypothetical protein